MSRLLGPALAGMLLAACGSGASNAQVATAWQDLPIIATPVEIDAPQWLGEGAELSFAGGVELTAEGSARPRELSDLKVLADGRLMAVGDEGELVDLRPVLDETGRLVGVEGGRIRRLSRPDGKGVQGSAESDAEGLAILPDGRFLVSFERRHRVWIYPADAGPPAAAPTPVPDAILPQNQGFEAVAAVGPDSYLVAAESGELWRCRLGAACDRLPDTLRRPGGEAISSMDADPAADRLFFIARRMSGRTPVAWTLMRIEAPATAGSQATTLLLIDSSTGADANFEGIAVTPTDRGLRLYIVSDDARDGQSRTLLLAFDWVRR